MNPDFFGRHQANNRVTEPCVRMEIEADNVLSPFSVYRHGDRTHCTASLFHKYLDGVEEARPLNDAKSKSSVTDDGELDAGDVLLALLFHRHEHDAEFTRVLSASHPHRLLYIESRRGKRRWGVDARRKQGENEYGELLMALRTAYST